MSVTKRRLAAQKAAAKLVAVSSDSEGESHLSSKVKSLESSSDENYNDWRAEIKGKSLKKKRCRHEDANFQGNEPPSKRAKSSKTPDDESSSGEKSKGERIKTDPSVISKQTSQKPLRKKRLLTASKRIIKESNEMGSEEVQWENERDEAPFGHPQNSSDAKMSWRDADLLAEREGVDPWVASNLIRLFEEGSTIPFIARYRKQLTKNMEPEQLRHCKETYEDVIILKQKATTSLKSIEKTGKLTSHIRAAVMCARSINELEHIIAPFKTGSKRTLAARAREIGLEPVAELILSGVECADLSSMVNVDKEGLQSKEEVKTGIMHIIADIVSKNTELLNLLQTLKKNANILLECSQAPFKETNLKGKGSQQDSHADKKMSAAKRKEIREKQGESSKFKNYFNFKAYVKYIKPHQVLAINRGESLKELTVRLVLPDSILHQITLFCKQRWLSKGIQYPLRFDLIDASIKDSYKRLIEPLIIRQVRADLFKMAERASIEVFAVNLRKLLLAPPYRGHVVLGIDPGFYHGCKVAVVDQSGEVLDTGVLHIHNRKNLSNQRNDENALWLRSTLIKHGCATIALGNGTACRETEEYLSHLIQSGFFAPHLDVSYTIVNEQGASVYSCSEEAKQEFPEMDPNIISAVSLARRLQNPLAELVKVDPKHLGVGMYQHDVAEKKLSNTLDEVVIECVSFVGIDLNTSSHTLLRRIAGLNASKANKILDYRKKNGPFTSREEIKKVAGIGPKTYEQCAGFIRILQETVGPRSPCNPLDRTWIHPESYELAKRFLDYCHIKLENLGCQEFIESIHRAVSKAGGAAGLAQHFGESESLMKLIIDGLQIPLNYDFRTEFGKPLFRKGLTSMGDLTCGDVLTGKIMNTTDFGAFVDIGVGRNGLIHKSAMGRNTPQLGDRVQVKIINLEKERQRIGLQLLEIL